MVAPSTTLEILIVPKDYGAVFIISTDQTNEKLYIRLINRCITVEIQLLCALANTYSKQRLKRIVSAAVFCLIFNSNPSGSAMAEAISSPA